MTLVSTDRYPALTGDPVAHDEVALEQALADAQRLVEEYLRRPLELAERTERLRVFTVDGRSVVYPRATPVSAVPIGHVIDGAAVAGEHTLGWSGWAPGAATWTTLTYIGGFTAETLPLTVAREIARVAQQLLTQSAPATEGGPVNVEGDADLSVPAVVPTLTTDEPSTIVDRVALRPYRRRHT